MFGRITKVLERNPESCTDPQPIAEAAYDDLGMPIPQCKAEELQMRFHMTPRLHQELPDGLHNN